jgi:outer membrane protein insertion porin family
MQRLVFGVLLIITTIKIFAQENPELVKYDRPRDYEIAEIKVTGVDYVQPELLANMSGLRVGSTITIPGDDISKVIQKFWSQQLFSDVKILATKMERGKVWLEIRVKERPRISKFQIEGVKKSEKQDLTEQLKIRSGSQLTPNMLNNIEHTITRFFAEKGFLNTVVNFDPVTDTLYANRVTLTVNVEKNQKVKIQDIDFVGNEVYDDRRLRRVMKNTKQRNLNIFKSSKFIRTKYKEDKQKLHAFYNKNGYRDFKILDDTIIDLNEKRIKLIVDIEEGNKYYFGDIEWVGNTVYPPQRLDKVLGINKGDVYNQELLDERLTIDDDAVTALYMDNGYLFFSVNPVEVDVESDTIDFEMQIHEGKQATIDEIIITGNTTTNEHVVRRELRTHPGDLFSRSKLIRSVRELASLGHFNPETISPNPIPNPSDGTVDIEYSLEERSNDQLEVSAGYGGYGAVGTIGLKFSNFSTRRIFDKEAWSPLPRGDGQTLSLRAQLNGAGYQSYNFSFVEPWFGGKKPNSFSFSVFYNIVDYGAQRAAISRRNPTYRNIYGSSNSSFRAIGSSVGLGRRLSWPDDFFSHYHEISFQKYDLQNYSISSIRTGNVHNLNIRNTLSRNSLDQTIYPRRGSNFSLSLQLTPPYSLLKEDNFWEFTSGERAQKINQETAGMSAEELDNFNANAYIANLENARRYKWLEYHKWTFKGAWYMSLIGNLVISPRIEYGHLAMYNRNVGHSPFEKFAVGGDGLSGYNITGTDIVALRGYPNRTLTPYDENGSENGNIYTKYTLELRYPFTLNPSATVFGLVFMEAGNAWSGFNEFNPFMVKRSAGVGVRAFLPMFGMLGIDWGYGFDTFVNNGREYGGKGEFHFILGQQF